MSQLYDPAKVSPWELPVIRDIVYAYDLYHIRNAQDMCIELLKRDRIPALTDNDYECIEIVANGGTWPVPDTVYDDDQWARDRTLKCVPGQEISESIYWNMFNVLPPLTLYHHERANGYGGGFLVSEPVTSDPEGRTMLYSAFGRKGDHYYYIGLLPARKP